MLFVFMALSMIMDAPVQPSAFQNRPISQAQRCYGIDLRTGLRAPVRHVRGESGGYWAYARPDEYGYPTIYYSSTYFRLDRTMQLFTAHHECGHHELATSDEVAANCYALAAMRPTNAQFQHIGRTMRSIPALGPQYGGSGAAFWDRTLAACGY
jgi:hypothetical protein